MSIDKEKFVFYLRLLLCSLIVIYWVVWLLTLPKPTKKEPPSITATETIIKEEKIPTVISTPEQAPIPKQISIPQATNKIIIAKTELPRLANLELNKPTEEKKPTPEIIENKKSQIKKEKEQVSIPINLALPMTAGATREALLNKVKQLQISKDNSDLRGKITIKKDGFKKELNDNDEFKESWLPKYLIEKDELKNKLESLTKNLDLIVNQLELEGIIKNPNGQNAAIIRNTETNDVEILKKGEEYKGLKILGITDNEVRLGNEGINKVYTKKIINKG